MTKTTSLLFAVGVCFFCMDGAAQNRYKKYDSIFYENIFAPTFSTMMMPKGYVEVVVANSLLTANTFWDNSQIQNSTFRYTYNYTLLQTNVGISSTARISAGMDMYFTMARIDGDRNSSPFNIFNQGAPGNVRTTGSLVGFAPRLKLVPFKNYKNFIYQVSLFIPTLTDSTIGQNTSWRNQFLYSMKWNNKLMSFVQADVDIYFSKTRNISNQYFVPVNFYLYWLATKNIFPFASIGYSTLLGKNGSPLESYNSFVPYSIGIQYQFSLRFYVNVNYSRYAVAQNNYDWKSFNLGVRMVF